MDFSSPPSTGDPARESISQCPTGDLQLPQLGTSLQRIPGLGLIQGGEPEILHYDHSQRTFRREGDTDTYYVSQNSSGHGDDKSELELMLIKAREANHNEASASHNDVATKDPRKRLLFDFMSRTPSSAAFDKYEEKLLKRVCPSFDDPANTIEDVHHGGSQSEAVNAAGAYPSRPFQGTDFNLSQQAAQPDVSQPVTRPHVQATQAQITQLTGIAGRIAVVCEHLRHSDDQLSDAYDRMSEANLAIEELRNEIQRSWDNIQSKAAGPREDSNANDSASGASFADIETKLKEITRKKALIEMEITGREAKRRRIEEAFSAFVPPQGCPALERLEETADEYVLTGSGL